MKRLTCEMCGSTELIKQEGVFVCQVCGCKYSVEEARKMMVEGTVDVSGSTVKVDTSEKLKNLYTLARRAKDEDNIQDAAKYYHEIRLEDPNSWEAIFYGVYFKALDCTNAEIESAVRSINNNIETVSMIIKDYVPQEEQKVAYTECLLGATSAASMLLRAANKYSLSGLDRNRIMMRGITFHDREYEDSANECLMTVMSAGLAAEVIFKDYELAETIYSTAVDMCGSYLELRSHANLPEEKIERMKPELEAIRQKRYDEYWNEHAEDKQKYEARIEEIESEIDQLMSQIAMFKERIGELKKTLKQDPPYKSKVLELKRQHSELNDQKSKLGIFAGKQKRALQEQIDALQTQIEAAAEASIQETKTIEARVDAELSECESASAPIMDKIESLKEEKAAIIDELTKAR